MGDGPTIQITVRLSVAEHTRLRQAARAAGIPAATWASDALTQAVRREFSDDTDTPTPADGPVVAAVLDLFADPSPTTRKLLLREVALARARSVEAASAGSTGAARDLDRIAAEVVSAEGNALLDYWTTQLSTPSY